MKWFEVCYFDYALNKHYIDVMAVDECAVRNAMKCQDDCDSILYIHEMNID